MMEGFGFMGTFLGVWEVEIIQGPSQGSCSVFGVQDPWTVLWLLPIKVSTLTPCECQEQSQLLAYRGTLLIRKHLSLGPCPMHMPRTLW